MKHPAILLLTRATDAHAHSVLDQLHRTHADIEVLCFDPHDFPHAVTLQAELSQGTWIQELCIHGERVALDGIRTIWLRRPTPPFVNPATPPHLQRFITDEARMALGGLLRSLPALWVNHPECNVTASYKPLQLQLACQLGLTVPRTLISNSQEAVQAFYEVCNGQIISKPLMAGALKPGPGEVISIYTSRVLYEHLQELHRVKDTAHLFQEEIAKRVELRVTVIGEQFFATEIHSQHAPRTQVDWRRSYGDLRYAPHILPSSVQQQLLALVRRCDLAFAAIDLIVTPSGEYVFIEINPNGQWLWLEEQAGVPLSEAFAHFLTHH